MMSIKQSAVWGLAWWRQSQPLRLLENARKFRPTGRTFLRLRLQGCSTSRAFKQVQNHY
jgi:hypothetical protein